MHSISDTVLITSDEIPRDLLRDRKIIRFRVIIRFGLTPALHSQLLRREIELILFMRLPDGIKTDLTNQIKYLYLMHVVHYFCMFS